MSENMKIVLWKTGKNDEQTAQIAFKWFHNRPNDDIITDFCYKPAKTLEILKT